MNRFFFLDQFTSSSQMSLDVSNGFYQICNQQANQQRGDDITQEAKENVTCD